MGESRRRKLMEADYGKPKMPEGFKDHQQAFLNKETDFMLRPVVSQHISAPVKSSLNAARQFITQDIFDQNIKPLIEENGKGWLVQIDNYNEDKTELAYCPATLANLRLLQTEIFDGDTGILLRSIIGVALEHWIYTPEKRLIPVVAISTIDTRESYIYCL